MPTVLLSGRVRQPHPYHIRHLYAMMENYSYARLREKLRDGGCVPCHDHGCIRC